MLDIGIGEILVLLVVGLLLLGPDRLPRYAAQVGRLLRQVRTLAEGARTQLVESAGVDPDSLRDLSSLADLHPRRLATSLLSDVPGVAAPAASGSASSAPAAQGSASPGSASSAPAAPAASGSATPAAPAPAAPGSASPAARTPLDPEAT